MPVLVKQGLSADEFHSLRTGNVANNAKIKISCVDVSVTVGKGKTEKMALHNVTSTFGAGKLTALMGPSGAGKVHHCKNKFESPCWAWVFRFSKPLCGSIIFFVPDDALERSHRHWPSQRAGMSYFVLYFFNFVSTSMCFPHAY